VTGGSLIFNNAQFSPAGNLTPANAQTPFTLDFVNGTGIAFAAGGAGNTGISILPNSLYLVNYTFGINYEPTSADISSAQALLRLNGAAVHLSALAQYAAPTGATGTLTLTSGGLLRTDNAASYVITIDNTLAGVPTLTSATFDPILSNLSIMQIM
jgi:hypothetical protein